MAKKKLGIGNIEINKKFKDKEEAYRYAKRLIEYIRYISKKNADKGWYAQAMVVSSNLMKDVSMLRYEITGKRGRPRKKHDISNIIANSWYKGNYKTDWHLHILLVSKPSYMFRNVIKDYIDKNWNEVPNAYEVEPFDIKKLNAEKTYKKSCNIKMADYFIWQCEEVLFYNHKFGGEEKLKYSLKEYYREYLKVDSARRRLVRRNVKNPMSEDKYISELEKIESKFNMIERYFLDITKEQDDKEVDIFMKKARINKIIENKEKNKVQDIRRTRITDDSLF